MRTIPRILIVRLSAMGDVLHALPAVGALRLCMPETHFGWVVEERWQDVIRCVGVCDHGTLRPIVDEVHPTATQQWRHSLRAGATWRQIWSTIQELRDRRYDCAIDFQGAARSAFLARLSASPSIYGFAEPRENVASMFYTTTIITSEKHVIFQNVALASAVAHHKLKAAPVKFACKGAGREPSPTHLSDYIVLNPGAGWGAKQWPAARYGEVAKHLTREVHLPCLINSGPGEEELVRTAESASGGSAAGISCSTLELITLMRNARLFIGGDTGPMHMAAALGVPVVAIFGPTDPARTGPFGTRNIVLRNPDSRMTLSHESSPDQAMLQISADEVVRAAIQLLRDTGE